MATMAAVRATRDILELDMLQLWIAYFEVGGNRDATQLAHLMTEDDVTDVAEHDHIIDALNDVLLDRGLGRYLPSGRD